MTPLRPAPRSSLLVALAAMLALFIQVLTPAAAMAHDLRESGSAIVICTADGAKVVTIKPDGSVETSPAKGFAGFKCSQCVGASLAVDPVQPPATIAPVRYAEHVETAPVRVLGARGHARAPPRPPGQGPPANLNA